MAIRQTNVLSKSKRLSECERILRSSPYIDTRTGDVADGRFEAVNPVPLTFDRETFRTTVEAAAKRYDLRVRETESPYRLVVTSA